jgi:hypothetical protein
VKFAAIADWATCDSYPVSFMCAELGVSRSGYYAWRTAAPSQRSQDDATFMAIMKKLCAEGRGNPGVRRLHAGLAALGHRLSRKRVWRLMRAAGLRGRHPRAWKRTTIGGDRPVSAPDRIGRAFHAERPNEKWCGSGSRRESHPPAPTEPCVIVSHYTALATLITRSCGTIASARTSSDIAA